MRYEAASILIMIFALLGCASGETNETNETAALAGAEYDLTTYEGLSAALEDDADIALYDVRTQEEYVSGHIPGAVNIPYDVIAEQIPVSDKDAVIVVYCRSGNRSGIAQDALEDAGYTNVLNFGAVADWQGELVPGMLPGGPE